MRGAGISNSEAGKSMAVDEKLASVVIERQNEAKNSDNVPKLGGSLPHISLKSTKNVLISRSPWQFLGIVDKIRLSQEDSHRRTIHATSGTSGTNATSGIRWLPIRWKFIVFRGVPLVASVSLVSLVPRISAPVLWGYDYAA